MSLGLLCPVLALGLGAVLDAVFGDPRGIPHVVVGMGRLIAALECFLRRKFSKTARGETMAGAVLVLVMLAVSLFLPLLLLFFVYELSLWFGMLLEGLLLWQLLAARDLQVESMAVFSELKKDDLSGARCAVGRIVGRDTERLDVAGVTRAAVETVAENCSDGVIAPLFYIALGGAPLGCVYKAVNTMDSMLGYKNEKYLHFGRWAARMDDALNYLPARLAAGLMILVCGPLGYDRRGAWRIYRRDRRNHASPNSAHTEAVCAGALGIRLGGDAYYFGQLHRKPSIGDDTRQVEAEDIPRANRLMLAASVLMLFLSLVVRGLLLGGVYAVF